MQHGEQTQQEEHGHQNHLARIADGLQGIEADFDGFLLEQKHHQRQPNKAEQCIRQHGGKERGDGDMEL
ncbi:hypothetical protein D3C75_1063590 [compost metagenome]